MAPRQTNRNLQKAGGQCSVPKGKACPQYPTQENPQAFPRRSARLQRRQERTKSKDTKTELDYYPASLASDTNSKEFPQIKDRKRKRSQEVQPTLPSSATPSQKQPRISPPQSHIKGATGQNATISDSANHRAAVLSPLSDKAEHTHSKYQCVPKHDLSPEETSNIKDSNVDPVASWLEGKPWYGMNQLFERKTLSSSKPETSDTCTRDGKNPAATNPTYELRLQEAGVYLDGDGPGITAACQALCKSLLETEQPHPPNSLFRDDRFEGTCRRLRNESEAKIIQQLSPLLVPSVEVLCTSGEDQLEHMVDHVNQRWHGCIPIMAGPAPQPDYCVGCKPSMFTRDQLRKLEPFIRGWKGTPFLATAWMYFPYLTAEAKCGNASLNIADRQNAHSASVAVKQVVDLYRTVSRQHELGRTILAFSVSHSAEDVRIYGYYPVIDGDGTSVYRHIVGKFNIMAEHGKNKWKTYTFTRNVYDIFGPIHVERLRSAIDQMADYLSDQRQSQPLGVGGMSQLDEEANQPDMVDSKGLSQSASSSQTSQPLLKKRKTKHS